MTTPSAPDLSVVVAASNGPALLERCLASLTVQADASYIEVIVARNYDGTATDAVLARFPNVQSLPFPAATTVPALRMHGLQAARGAVVALAEDHCAFAPGWCRAVREAHARQPAVAAFGGAVEHRSGPRPLDWAVFFYEYGKYMPPVAPGPAPTLPGNNASYKRAALDDVAEDIEEGFFETFVHQRLQAQGHALHMAPAAVVLHLKTYALRRVLSDCFHHGRSFAGMRRARVSPLARTALTVGAAALPVLLPARIARQVLQKRRHARELLRAFPYLLLFMSAWAAGELCGYAAGPGASTARWT